MVSGEPALGCAVALLRDRDRAGNRNRELTVETLPLSGLGGFA